MLWEGELIMKKYGKYLVITLLGIIAVFAGNILFSEYQDYKVKKEMREIAREKNNVDLEMAKVLAKSSVEFGKPIIIEEGEKWEIKIQNKADVYVWGGFKVELYDAEENVLVTEYVYIESSELPPYEDFIYVGHISEENKKKVSNYKILDFGLHAIERNFPK